MLRFEAGGNLDLTGDVTLTGIGTTQVLLAAGAGVDQTPGTQIIADQLFLRGTGDFNVNSAAFNDVSQLLADIDGSLDFSGGLALEIAGTTTFDTACGTSVELCGVNIDQNGGAGGDLAITLNNANLTQVGSVTVEGNSRFDLGTGVVWLDDGDCTGDGINDNDFVGTVSVDSATGVEIVDINDLVAGVMSVVNDVRLIAAGNIDLTGDITLTGLGTTQVFLGAGAGVDQTDGTRITATQLFLQGTGEFLINSNATPNIVSELLADIDGGLNYSGDVDLSIAGLTTFDTDCGTSIQLCGVNIDQNGGAGGDLVITLTDDNLTQVGSVTVEGHSNLNVGTGDICLTEGDCSGDGVNDNDFVGIVEATGDTIEIVDINDLIVGQINGGIDVRLVAGGNLDLTGDITLSGGGTTQLFLSAEAGAQQTDGTQITANQLFMQGTGDFDLDSTSFNAVNQLAADIDGRMRFFGSEALEILGTTSYQSSCLTDIELCGINIDQNGGVDGDLSITLQNQNLTQVGSVTVEGNALFDLGTGVVWLTGGDCSGDGINDNDFVGAIGVTSAGGVEIVDINDLIAGPISALDDVRLEAGDNLDLTGNIILSGVAPTQVYLAAGLGVDQTDGTSITATQLFLQGTGDFVLNTSAFNDVSVLLADIDGNLLFNGGIDLAIGGLTNFATACGTSIDLCGVNIDQNGGAGGNLNLNLDNATLSQVGSVTVEGDTTFDTGTGVVWLDEGDCTGDGINDNDFVGTVTVVNSAAVEIVDVNDLVAGSITSQDDVRLESGGNLDLTGDIVLSGTAPTQVYLAANNGVDQTAGTQITATQLFLSGDGDFLLNSPVSNNVSQLAAAIRGNLEFRGNLDLDIAGTTSFATACGTNLELCGVDIDQVGGVDGNLSITLDNVSLSQTGSVTVEGDTTLTTGTGNICFTGGDCSGDGVNDNDFVGDVQVVSATTAEIVDINDLTILSATASNQLRFWAGDGNPGLLTLSGNIAATNEVFLQASNGVSQTAGFIDTNELMLGGDDAAENTGTFDLNLANVVDVLSGNLTDALLFNNTQDLQLSALTYDSICTTNEVFAGFSTNNLTITVAGDLFDSATGVAGDGVTVDIVIGSTAIFDVADNIVLGDGAVSTLTFTGHQLTDLVGSLVSTDFVDVVAADNVSFEADSTVIFAKCDGC